MLRVALAAVIGIGVGLGVFRLWANTPGPGAPSAVSASTLQPTPRATTVIAARAPTEAAAPTELPRTEPTDLPPRKPTILPAPTAAPSPTVNTNSNLQAEIESAMRSIVPDGSAELIAHGGSLVAQYRASAPRTAASTIKLALLLELLRQAEAGTIDLDAQITIRSADVVGGTGNLQHQVGRTLTLRELAHQMILSSDNVAANLLVDRVGMANVNALARANGYPSTAFRRHMLDTAAQAAGIENVTSAADLAGMVEAVVRGSMVSSAVSARAGALLAERGDIDKDWLGLNLPAGARLAHINGTLDGVRNDVGLITSPSGKSFVLAVCQDHLPSDAAGEAAIARLARRLYDLMEAS